MISNTLTIFHYFHQQELVAMDLNKRDLNAQQLMKLLIDV